MLVITERKKVGMICGHAIYAVSKSKMIPIPYPPVRSNSNNSKNEIRSFVHSACKCKTYLVLVRDAYSTCVSKSCSCPFVVFPIFAPILFSIFVKSSDILGFCLKLFCY